MKNVFVIFYCDWIKFLRSPFLFFCMFLFFFQAQFSFPDSKYLQLCPEGNKLVVKGNGQKAIAQVSRKTKTSRYPGTKLSQNCIDMQSYNLNLHQVWSRNNRVAEYILWNSVIIYIIILGAIRSVGKGRSKDLYSRICFCDFIIVLVKVLPYLTSFKWFLTLWKCSCSMTLVSFYSQLFPCSSNTSV